MPDIFKAYDIRGIYPSELDGQLAERIGGAFVTLLRPKTVVLGHDLRTSSPALAKAVTDGITARGTDVLDIGPCTTPMFYFAVAHLKADAGMMVTASHNPAQYNGLKMAKAGAAPFGDEEIQEIKRLVERKAIAPAARRGNVTKREVLAPYIDRVCSFASLPRRLKLVVDTGNGMCGLTVPEVLKKLPLEVTFLCKEIDLTYPNHEANPLKTETLKHLQQEVRKQHADIGIAFDGDGDRVGFVDERSEVVPMDLAGGLIAVELLKKNPGAAILYDIRSSHAVPELVRAANGTAEKTRVGHYFIKKRMRELDAAFALELSGHYYFRDLSFTDSGIVAALSILSTLSSSRRPFSWLMKPFRKYAKTGEINFEAADKDAALERLRQRYADAKLDFTDGITIEYGSWWCNVRKSNTEPLLRLNLEAESTELMEEKVSELSAIIRESIVGVLSNEEAAALRTAVRAVRKGLNRRLEKTARRFV